jgi:hypothetical protein
MVERVLPSSVKFFCKKCFVEVNVMANQREISDKRFEQGCDISKRLVSSDPILVDAVETACLRRNRDARIEAGRELVEMGEASGREISNAAPEACDPEDSVVLRIGASGF